jgi:hypothetical protein
MARLRYTDVFVPGGFPRHTYNPRVELQVEDRVRQVLENLCKLMIVTGHTKSGKTVLVRNMLPREDHVWVEGGVIGDEQDFWSTVIDQLNLFQDLEASSEISTEAELSAKGKAGANFFVATGEAEVGGSYASGRSAGESQSRSVSSRIVALKGLDEAHRALVIDDFHYLPRHLQGSIVRAVKPLVFNGVPVVIIAIPHRRYDAVKVEREMTGRIMPVEIPAWSIAELAFIPEKGFHLLNTTISSELIEYLANESIGSPHLMQEFCSSICRAHGITETFDGIAADLDYARLKTVFHETAETIGRPIFEKLARGPRQRTDRIQRKLRTGEEVDIYGLVLHGLAHLRPGLITLEYEDLRSAIREVAADDPPQLHEVARVLKHMSEIAATDQSSTPVIDFDEEEKVLHVTDPFFAFYLRWGSLTA